MSNRPTVEAIAEAREWFVGDGKRTLAHLAANYPESYGAILVLLAATEPPTIKELAELLAKHWHGEFCETFDVEYAQFRMTRGDHFDVAENVKFAVSRFLGLVKP